MEPLNFRKEVMASTPLDQNTTGIICEYSEEDVTNLSSVISPETIKKIFSPPTDVIEKSLVGRLTAQNAEKRAFFAALQNLISKAKIINGEKFLEDLEKIDDFENLEISSEAFNSEDNKNFVSRSLLTALSSDYLIVLSERLVIHLLTSASQSEKSKEQTITDLVTLSKLAKESPLMRPFIKDVINILKFNSNINITKEITKESLELIEELLSKNPSFAKILFYLIPQEARANCIKTLLDADFKESRVSPYTLKTKLLIAALELDPSLRLELPDNFLDKVSLEGRRVSGTLGKFNLNDRFDSDTLGDCLFRVDFSIVKDILEMESENPRTREFIENTKLRKIVEIQGKLISEMNELNNKNFRLPFQLDIGFIRDKESTEYKIETLMREHYKNKVTEKDDKKDDK